VDVWQCAWKSGAWELTFFRAPEKDAPMEVPMRKLTVRKAKLAKLIANFVLVAFAPIAVRPSAYGQSVARSARTLGKAAIPSLPDQPLSAAEAARVDAASSAIGQAQTSVSPFDFLAFPSSYFPANNVSGLAVGDVNGDGKQDVVAVNCGNDSTCSSQTFVTVLLGNGDGTFAAGATYSTLGYSARAVALADVNLDGKFDILVANCGTEYDCFGLGSVAVLLGNGDGTFQSAVTYSTSISIADLNHDGRPDLVVANVSCPGNLCGSPGGLSVLLGNGDGSFQPAALYGSGGTSPSPVVIADVNGDKNPDLIVANECSNISCTGDGAVGVLLGLGDGTFAPYVTYASGGAISRSLAAADVNRDGKLDLVVANENSSTYSVLIGNGDGTFRAAKSYPINTWVNGGGPARVLVADVNLDRKPDLLLTVFGVGVLPGNGNGTFGPVVLYDVGDVGVQPYAVADMNGDGKPDVVVYSPFLSEGGGVGVLLNNYGTPPTTTTIAASPDPLTINGKATYTATVTPQAPGTVAGAVEFFQAIPSGPPYSLGRVPLVDNQASLTTQPYTYTAQYQIFAVYSGELNQGATSQSSSLTEYIRGTSRTVLATSGSPSTYGQPVTLTATVTSKYGSVPDGDLVNFVAGTLTLGSAPTAGGQAKLTTSALPGGAFLVKANFVGDNGFAPSTGGKEQVVLKYATTTTVSSSLNPSTLGQSVTFTATVASTGTYTPTGKVLFFNGTASMGSAVLNNGVARLTKSTLPVGTHAITARYYGDIANQTSTSNALDQVVK
jgi:hypothetical protein